MLDDIIKYENEHSGLDFKAIQYRKDKYADLLKDIMSMANANIESDRLIIIGVKHRPNGEKEFLPIEKVQFVDASTYQQLVHENIEPELLIDYEPYQYEDILLGVIRLSNCTQQPYMMKKDYTQLKKGDCFIRKGSYQKKVARADLEQMYEKRNSSQCQFVDNVDIGFFDTNFMDEILLSPLKKIELRSEREEKKIKDIIQLKEQSKKDSETSSLSRSLMINKIVENPLAYVPYEKRSISTLYRNLEKIKETYKEDDVYEILELKAFKLNFEILNKASEYIEDAYAEIEILKDDSFHINSEILEKPYHGMFPQIPHEKFLNSMSYPHVEEDKEKYFISNSIGNIKHQIKTEMFDEDLRLIIFKVPESSEIIIHLKLYGKNLSLPIEKELKIKVLGQ